MGAKSLGGLSCCSKEIIALYPLSFSAYSFTLASYYLVAPGFSLTNLATLPTFHAHSIDVLFVFLVFILFG